MPIACWIPKATNFHSECVIFIAFPLQQWLHEGVSVLRLCVCLVFVFIAWIIFAQNVCEMDNLLCFDASFRKIAHLEDAYFVEIGGHSANSALFAE